MRRHLRLVALACVAVVLVLAALLWWRMAPSRAAARVPVPGGDGGGLPIAQPSDEHFDVSALAAVIHDPAASGLQAFIVMRHGHIVFTHYGHGTDADTMIDSGPFARVLAALVAGVAVQQGVLPAVSLSGFDPDRVRAALEQSTGQPYPAYLSHKLWSRLNAGPAWILLPVKGASAPAGCCFEARVQDWMRIAGLLIGDGDFEGTRVLRGGWVARMRAPLSTDGRQGLGVELPSKTPAAQRFNADDLFFLRGPGRWRIWLVPSLQLAVLFGAPAGQGAPTGQGAPAWDETRLPNLVMASLTDSPQSQKTDSLMRRLVPGH